MTVHRPGPSRALLTALLLVAGLPLAGCGGDNAASAAAEPPAVLQAGEDGSLPRIVLSDEAEHRLGIETRPVLAAPASAGSRVTSVIPYAAVVYDAAGAAWAFSSPDPRTYVRVPLKIVAITGNRVDLSSGPAVGTALVTVGAPELVGVESGISGEE